MEAILRKKLMTLIGGMIPSGLIVKTDFGDEVVIGYQIRTDSDEFDAVIITNNQNENKGVYRLDDVVPYLRTYFQLTESEKTHLSYLDDDYEKTETSIALSYMLCATDRDGNNEFIENGLAIKAPKGMYEPVDWRKLCGDDYDDDDDDEDEDDNDNINFSNDDIDDEEDYDEE